MPVSCSTRRDFIKTMGMGAAALTLSGNKNIYKGKAGLLSVNLRGVPARVMFNLNAPEVYYFS